MDKTIKYRSWYRKNKIPSYYSGIAHCLATSIVLLGSSILAISKLQRVQLWEYLVVPMVVILSNLFEYLFHRFPLHHSLPGFKSIYRIHTLEHHRFYDERHPSWENTKDFHTVLFPPWASVLAIAIFWFVGHFILSEWITINSSLFFIATASAFFFAYEVLHYFHHVPGGKKTLRFSLLKAGRRHHLIHHDPVLMGRKNFNVTFPLFDWIFKTLK